MTTAKVCMYCKIYTENFPFWDTEKEATGEQITNFLLSDAEVSFDNEILIPGDLIIWYLATSEKRGMLDIIINNEVVFDEAWGRNQSSWDRVKKFVSTLYEKEIITNVEYDRLNSAISEGETNFNSMYEIVDYLKSKTSNK